MLNWIHLHEIEKKDKRGVTQYDDNFFLLLIAKCYNLVETQQISTRFSSQKRKKKSLVRTKKTPNLSTV